MSEPRILNLPLRWRAGPERPGPKGQERAA